MRFNELIAGVRSDLAVKVFGDDMEVLHETGGKISKILEKNTGGIRRQSGAGNRTAGTDNTDEP